MTSATELLRLNSLKTPLSGLMEALIFEGSEDSSSSFSLEMVLEVINAAGSGASGGGGIEPHRYEPCTTTEMNRRKWVREVTEGEVTF